MGSEAGETVPAGVQCDFCARYVHRVRRVALDVGYERLQTPHEIQYACTDCSEAKDRDRAQRASS